MLRLFTVYISMYVSALVVGVGSHNSTAVSSSVFLLTVVTIIHTQSREGVASGTHLIYSLKIHIIEDRIYVSRGAYTIKSQLEILEAHRVKA